MRLIGLAVILTVSLVLAPLAAKAQQPAKIARIGYLSLDVATSAHLRDAFLQGLRDLGYVEGRNVAIEYRDAEGKSERLPPLAAELVALKVDVIVAGGTQHALAAKQATRTHPIVFASPPAPVESGLVTSLARPGGDVTVPGSRTNSEAGRFADQERARASDARIRARRRARASIPVT